jgi:hypothetical protein
MAIKESRTSEQVPGGACEKSNSAAINLPVTPRPGPDGHRTRTLIDIGMPRHSRARDYRRRSFLDPRSSMAWSFMCGIEGPMYWFPACHREPRHKGSSQRWSTRPGLLDLIGSRGPCFEDSSQIISTVHHGRLSSTEHPLPIRPNFRGRE